MEQPTNRDPEERHDVRTPEILKIFSQKLHIVDRIYAFLTFKVFAPLAVKYCSLF